MKVKVAIIGASGYAGAQLVSILSHHPEVSLIYLGVQSRTDTAFYELYQGFSHVTSAQTVTIDTILNDIDAIDVLFLALPHGISMNILKSINRPPTLKIIDLGADFRLKSAEDFEYWYNTEHQLPSLLGQWVYGLPELQRNSIRTSQYIANPGCYPTASILAAMPLLKNGLIDPKSLIVDAKSGVTGAGRSLSLNTHYCECTDSIKAYGVGTHRHTAEIEQTFCELTGEKFSINFTPHLIPMPRGILSTVYSKSLTHHTTEELLNLYKDFYANEPFVRVRDELPETRWVSHSNFCDISVRYDPRTNRIIALGAIDNLIKGASGQAVQNMNIMMGLEETTGLPKLPLIP